MEIEINKLTHIINSKVIVPSSKSYTHRAIILSCLANGTSIISNPLICDDTKVTIECMKQMGFHIESSDKKDKLIIKGGVNFSNFTNNQIKLNFRESGTTARFIVALCSIFPYKIKLTADKSLINRPMFELVETLKKLGIKIIYNDKKGYLPLTIEGNSKLKGGLVNIVGNKTSQYISALMIISPFMENGLEINIDGKKPVSKPYIELTKYLMHEYGIFVKVAADRKIIIKSQFYNPTHIDCEGDYTSASYLMTLTAIIGGELQLFNLKKNSIQGDKYIIEIMKLIGCDVHWRNDNSLEISSNGTINPIDIDMINYPDLVPTVSILCALSKGQSILRNISHLKFKESNRIHSIIENLKKLNLHTEYKSGNLIIYGKDINKLNIDKLIKIETYSDHRIAMSFSILGLKRGNIIIDDKNCVTKSFPDFWDIIQNL